VLLEDTERKLDLILDFALLYDVCDWPYFYAGTDEGPRRMVSANSLAPS
jgi:hypothetical protein